MKTEDDTYRVLKREPFETVQKTLKRNRRAADYEYEEMERFLLSFGWTIDEYDKVLLQK